MTYFEDLSDYAYAPGSVRPGTKAVGWLAGNHAFPTMIPDEETLDLLWLYCSISVAQTRGGYDCDFCHVGSTHYFERKGQRLRLGTSEIRVFARDGQIYASPTLVYHYVAVHNYKPPDVFLQALRDGPRPPSQEYFAALAKLNLEWNKTSKGAPKDRILLPYKDPDARNYLDKIGTLNDLARGGLKLQEGLVVHFYYCHLGDGDDPQYMLFEGTVHFDSDKKQWYAMIDQKSLRRESEVISSNH